MKINQKMKEDKMNIQHFKEYIQNSISLNNAQIFKADLVVNGIA